MKLLKGKKGFTLIELVVVIAILGILAGIAIPRFLDATATARGAKIIADMRTIDSAAVIYNAKTGNVASSKDQLTTADGGSKFQLLASWPVPPSGTAKITIQSGTNKGKEGTITKVDTEYGFSATDGRAILGGTEGKTVDQLLAGDGVTVK